jgi:hypothetical protein
MFSVLEPEMAEASDSENQHFVALLDLVQFSLGKLWRTGKREPSARFRQRDTQLPQHRLQLQRPLRALRPAVNDGVKNHNDHF